MSSPSRHKTITSDPALQMALEAFLQAWAHFLFNVKMEILSENTHVTG